MGLSDGQRFKETEKPMITHHAALIYTMVFVAASDTEIGDAEFRTIGDIIKGLPAFRDFDTDKLIAVTNDCAEILQKDDGLDEAFDLVKEALPVRLRETAYALACDVAVSDGVLTQPELRLLEMIRHRLDIDRLIAAGIERGSRARFAHL